MKKVLLSGALILLSSAPILAQGNSDDPIYNNVVPQPVPVSLVQPEASVAKTIIVGGITINGEILPCDSTSTALVATNGACGYQWYSDSLGSNVLSSGTTLELSGISGDTVVYVSEAIAAFDSILPLPPHGSTYTGNVRGYWFQAPTDIIITAATVPTEASSGLTNIAILKFDTAAPPLWGNTTNAFTVLGLWQNEAADTVFMCVPVDSGDWIGVLGNRNDMNSYASAPYLSSINGIPTTLTRMGMQLPLSSNAPLDVFSEPAGSISRVKLIYGTPTPIGPIYPVPVTAPQPSLVALAMSICDGDSTLLGGAMQTMAGVYMDSLTAANGCDSIISTTLTIELPSSSSETVDLCVGDSIMINGIFITNDGTYVDSLSSMIGCDSLATMVVAFMIVDATATQAGFVLTATNASATYQWVDCNNGNSAIIGQTGQTYTATANGSYAVQVTENGCTEMSACFDYTTIGIDEYNLGAGFTIYPNPTNDIVNYSFTGLNTMDFVLTNVAGQILWIGSSSSNQGTIDLGAYASGTYLLDVTNGDKNATIRLIKN